MPSPPGSNGSSRSNWMLRDAELVADAGGIVAFNTGSLGWKVGGTHWHLLIEAEASVVSTSSIEVIGPCGNWIAHPTLVATVTGGDVVKIADWPWRGIRLTGATAGDIFCVQARDPAFGVAE